MKSFGYFSYLIPTPMLLFPLHDDPKTLSLEEWYWFVVLPLSYLKSLSALPHTLHLLASSSHASLVHVRYQAHTFTTRRHGTHHVYLIVVAVRLICMQPL